MDFSSFCDITKMIISFLAGGGIGVLVGIRIEKRATKQYMKSGDHSSLIQVGEIRNGKE